MVSETLKKQIYLFLLALGFSLIFRITILGQEKFHLILLVMASITAIHVSHIQKFTIDWDLMRNTQEHIKAFQKEFPEAQLYQNTYMLKKLEDQRKDVIEDQMKPSKRQFRKSLNIGGV